VLLVLLGLGLRLRIADPDFLPVAFGIVTPNFSGKISVMPF